MENSYRFFNNKACEYFPCHEIKQAEDFNCLFCYCPLYFFRDCGGNYTMRDQTKDCSACKLPHHPKGYDYILKKLRQVRHDRKDKGDQ